MLPIHLTLTVGMAVALTAASWSRPAVEYLLPYPVGDSARLIQGNHGPWGHSGALAWAYDFQMAIGSPVVAARAGVVVAVVEGYEDGNRTPGQENFVFVRHADSTYARYYHLTRDGALVEAGQAVEAGQVIAKSGNTGASAGPHLHFDVTARCPEWGCQTIPIRFRNAGADSVAARAWYRARQP